MAFDWEPITGDHTARTSGLSGETLTQCALAFCAEIGGGGLYPRRLLQPGPGLSPLRPGGAGRPDPVAGRVRQPARLLLRLPPVAVHPHRPGGRHPGGRGPEPGPAAPGRVRDPLSGKQTNAPPRADGTGGACFRRCRQLSFWRYPPRRTGTRRGWCRTRCSRWPA